MNLGIISKLKADSSRAWLHEIALPFSLALSKILAVTFIYLLFGGPTGFQNEFMRTDSLTKLFPTRFQFLYVMTYWDTNWYMGIAKYGYPGFHPTSSYPISFALSPMYPLLIRSLFVITQDIVFSAVAISFIFSLGWAIVLRKTAELYMAPKDATIVTSLAVFFPVTFFVTTIAYSEAIFLFLSTSAWLLYRRRRYLASGVASGICTITRNYGAILPVLMCLDMVRRRQFKAALALLIPSAICYLAYMLYGYSVSGDLFISLHAWWWWYRGPPSVGSFLWELASGNIVELLPFVMAFLWYGGLVLLLCMKVFETEPVLGVYSLFMFLFLVFISSSASLPRYLFGSIFPLWLGVRLSSKRLAAPALALFLAFSLLLLYQFNSGLPLWYP